MSRKLHVQNLAHGVKLSEFESLFIPFGGTCSARVIDPLGTISATATAFVELNSQAERDAAIAALDGAVYQGNRLTVSLGEGEPAEDVNPSHMFESMNVPEPGEGDTHKTPGGERPPPASSESQRSIAGINTKGVNL